MARKKKADGELDGRQVLESLNGKGGSQSNASEAKASKNAKASKTAGGKKAKGGKRNSSTVSSNNSKGKASSRLAHGAAALAAKPASAAAGLVVRTLTCLCLAFSLFGAGLLACSTKEATRVVGQTFSNWSDSTLPADDMAAIAEEVRLFSMGQASADDLRDTTIEHVKKSYPEVAQVLETGSLAAGMTEDAAKTASVASGSTGSNTNDGSTDEATSNGIDNATGSEASESSAANASGAASPITDLASNGSNGSNPATQLADALGLPAGFSTSGSITTTKIDSWFSLPENAVSHLADCIPVFVTAQGATVFAAIAALAGLIWLGACRGRKAVGQTMILGACIPLTLLLAIGLWALVDFNGLFAAMHGLFFSAGTWTFPSDSLLIKLFPEAFWAAMAGLWAAVSIGLSLVCLAIGRLVRKGAK